MKTTRRLEYEQLAELLAERGLVEPLALAEALNVSATGQTTFPEALVSANLVADWELSRLVCELFSLPFLSVDQVTPQAGASEGIDPNLLRQSALVPLFRHGKVLTVCMPGMIPDVVLNAISTELGVIILPVVGTVRSNRMWVEEHVRGKGKDNKVHAAEADDSAPPATDLAAAWADIFDAADAAVLLDLEADEHKLALTTDGGDPELSETIFRQKPTARLPVIGNLPPKAPPRPVIEIEYEDPEAA